ncbi:uncharacterized protein MKK02DRAFT_39915 [Dioszegia hungarica]|uniref:Proteasome assembly chaperone 4 n=1 Tax=Dioszegia hungarica TaxID=4972 RepID=A0AA38HHX9_9TREE|nr:uncharacterized protein MKK02DRAFT_39915 [Dioszegia hungarica]KAI9639594.1 hypothetical protein MKK02DRAFT_39915 [Dioszegia hungarica]
MESFKLAPQISTHHTHISPSNPYAPAFIFHLTRLTSTLFVWVGTGSSTGAGGPGSGVGLGQGGMGGVGEGGEGGMGGERKLAADWGVAMPSRGSMPTVATPVFRSGALDLAVPMAQRLARKFPSNQIHLSLSLPPTLTAPSGPSLDPSAGRTLLVMEKELGKWLEQVTKESTGAVA